MKEKYCRVTGRKITEFQSKTYGLFAGSLVRHLYKKNKKNVDHTIEDLKKYTLVEELNAYFENWKSVSLALTTQNIENKKEIYNKYFLEGSKCSLIDCDKKVPYEHIRRGACCITHSNQQFNITSGKFNIDDYKFRCLECDMKYANKAHLTSHITETHGSDEEYYLKHFNGERGKCLWCYKDMKFNNIWEGYDSFCYNTSCNINYYNKNHNRHCCGEGISKGQKESQNMPNQLGYWIKKGYTEDGAILKIRERQTTNSVDAIMKREKCDIYEATEKRKNITSKWLSSLPTKSYSNISQELFWSIYMIIKEEYLDIFFATLNENKCLEDVGKNYEYKVKTDKTIRSLDFYIRDVNKVIEFNGEYWHSERNIRGKYTIERDIEREKEIKKTLNCSFFIVNEKKYNANKQKVIDDCLDFIRNG